MASSPGNPNPNNPPPFDLGTLFKPSSSPFPTPPASYPPPAGPFLHNEAVTSSSSSPAANLHQQQRTLSYPTPPVNLQSPRANHNPGTHLLALLNNSNGAVAANQEPPSSHHQEIARSFPSGPIRVPSCKFPMGRRLSGEHAVYDVDVRLHGEIQPQLEVTPITKYGSDPQLVVGRQIAVSKVYICYGLKGGSIRVLNINTALRALFRGHSQVS